MAEEFLWQTIRTCLKNFVSILFYCILTAFISISWLPLQAASAGGSSPNKIDSLYTQMNLQQQGLSKQAFAFAYKGYRRLLQKKIISSSDYLVICDFSQSSKNKRLYILDLVNKKVVLTTYVAHGRKSGGEFATRFSNKSESQQSSLGFYIAQSTYHGEHGLSLRMAGLEKGYNDRALKRNIVIHGADYIGESRLKKSGNMGRSYGCPALPRKECNQVIDMIKNGSCIFIYHPSRDYLNGSKLLNG